MSGLEDSGIILIVIVAFTILLIEIIIYLTRMSKTAGARPQQSLQPPLEPLMEKSVPPSLQQSLQVPMREKADSLLSTIQSGFHDVVTRSADFQEQIRYLQIVSKIHAASPDALEEDATTKFNENSQKIDQLSEQYSLLTRDLVALFQEENAIAITAPGTLHDHRLKEIGTLNGLSDLSNRIQPLLDENILIVSPVVRGPKEASYL